MLVAGALLACAPPSGDDEDTESDTEAGEDFEEPEFLEPPGGELRIAVDRTEDVTLAVRDIQPGLTRVFVDGLSLGTAQSSDGWIQLSSETLTIRLTGSMTEGSHTLQMRTAGAEESLDSQEISIDIAAVELTGLSASMRDTVAFEADAIDAHGHGEHGALFGVDLSTDPVSVTVAPASGEGWTLSEAVTLPLAGFDRTDEPRFTLSAFVQTLGEDRRLRMAWRTGSEGRALVGTDILWPPLAVATQSVIDLDDELPGYEYTKLGRPLLLGDTLVVEALLATDVEQPHPGDRTLLTARVDPDTARFGSATTSAVGQRRDIDRIAPVRDLLTHAGGGTPGLAARVAGLRTVAFEIDAVTGTLVERATGASDRFSSLRDGMGPPHVVLGAFASRQASVPLQVDAPSVFLRHFDDRRQGESEDAAPGSAALADITDVTAPVTSTVIGGVPLYLIPQGVDTPAVGILSAGPTPIVRSLEGLACDELAVPVSLDAAISGSIDVACRRGRDVFLGTLTLDEQP